MAKYLICVVQPDGYGDEMEVPYKVCESYTLEETDGCNVYEVEPDGLIGRLVKSNEDYSSVGFALVKILEWSIDGDDKREVLAKFPVEETNLIEAATNHPEICQVLETYFIKGNYGYDRETFKDLEEVFDYIDDFHSGECIYQCDKNGDSLGKLALLPYRGKEIDCCY